MNIQDIYNRIFLLLIVLIIIAPDIGRGIAELGYKKSDRWKEYENFYAPAAATINWTAYNEQGRER